MKPQGLKRLITFLALAVLFLTACQPAALATTNPPAKPAATATLPLEANLDAPAVEPTGAVPQAAPTAEGAALPRTGFMVPAGWQAFDNAAQGYSLAYPMEWAIGSETKYSRVFTEIQKEPAGMGPPLRLYVSIFPKEFTNQDWEVYNFITSESIQGFMALPVGGSKLREPNAVAPDYFTYTRLPDRVVAGKTGMVIENSKVWEAPSGTKERVVIIVTDTTTYMLGMYYETPQQLAMFEQVLDSFQAAP